jgi:hypothetical protein
VHYVCGVVMQSMCEISHTHCLPNGCFTDNTLWAPISAVDDNTWNLVLGSATLKRVGLAAFGYHNGTPLLEQVGGLLPVLRKYNSQQDFMSSEAYSRLTADQRQVHDK